jgi:hypothetical protein
MQEILTAATYVIAWLACDNVLGIESGMTKLLISLGAAFGVYFLMAIRESRIKKSRGGSE